VELGTHPVDPTPTAEMTLKNKYNCHLESIQLHKQAGPPKGKIQSGKPTELPSIHKISDEGPIIPWMIQNSEKALPLPNDSSQIL